MDNFAVLTPGFPPNWSQETNAEVPHSSGWWDRPAGSRETGQAALSPVRNMGTPAQPVGSEPPAQGDRWGGLLVTHSLGLGSRNKLPVKIKS